MPPKIKKSAEERTVDAVTHHDDREESVSPEATLGRGSEASTLALSPEILQQILAVNSQTILETSKTSFSALLAALPSSVAAVSTSAITVYLSGRAQASFSQVGDDMLDDYEKVKEVMLESLGDTPASADRRWWTIHRTRCILLARAFHRLEAPTWAAV